MRRSAIFILTATAAMAPMMMLTAQGQSSPAPGNAAAGARQYLQCRACHTVTKDGPDAVGPNLWGIMGKRSAGRPGFAYSPAMKGASLIWSAEAMDAFLAKPNERVPGNKMAFAGMANPAARRDLIAYLATLKDR